MEQLESVKEENIMEYDAYMEMANAIVKQACEDYVKSQLKLMGIKKTFNEETGEYVYKEKYIKNEETLVDLRRMIIDCIVFFKSDWCDRLSPEMTGQRLINFLNDCVRSDVAAYKKQQEEIERKREEEKLRKQEERRKKKEAEKKVKEIKPEVKEPERVITQEDIEKTLGSFTLEEIV